MTQSLMRERLMKKNGETGVGLDPISTYQGKPSQCSTPYFRQPGVSGSGRVASQAEISGSGTLSFVLGRGKQLIGIGLTRARASVLSLGCWAARARALHFFLTTTSSYHVVAQFKSMSGTIMVSYHPSLSLSLFLSLSAQSYSETKNRKSHFSSFFSTLSSSTLCRSKSTKRR